MHASFLMSTRNDVCRKRYAGLKPPHIRIVCLTNDAVLWQQQRNYSMLSKTQHRTWATCHPNDLSPKRLSPKRLVAQTTVDHLNSGLRPTKVEPFRLKLSSQQTTNPKSEMTKITIYQNFKTPTIHH